jgi:hypothetical protein
MALGVTRELVAGRDEEEASTNLDAACWPFGGSGCTVTAAPQQALHLRLRRHRRCKF